MKKIKKLLCLFCNLLVFSSCTVVNNKSNTSISQEKVNIHFIQYDLQQFYFNEKSGFWGYDKILWDIKVEYDYNYFLTYNEAENMMEKSNKYIPPLNGDGYWSFTRLYTSKNLRDDERGIHLEFSNQFNDCYLTQDMELYYGIYG